MTINKETVADFSWSFGKIFFLEISEGLFEWSDPDYGGDNVIRKSSWSSLEERYEKTECFVRSKGTHIIESYCGPNVKFEL